MPRSGQSAGAGFAAPASARRVGRLVVLSVVVAIIAVAIALSRQWRPLRYGRLDPPQVDTASLEKPLIRRLRDLTNEVSSSPYSAEAWGRLGVAFGVHDMPEEAATCYERAHRLDPSAFAWAYFLGLVKLDSDHVAALEQFERAARLDPDYAPLHLHLARGYFDTARLDESRTHYARAAALEPSWIRPHIGQAQVALARDDPRAAKVHLNRALALDPRTGEVHFLLAECARRLGDDAAASRHLERAGGRMQFEDFPDRVRQQWQWDAGVTIFWRSTRSMRYMQEEMVERAIAEWTSLLAEDPTSVRAYVELGRIYETVRQPDQALAAYRRALEIDAGLHSVHHGVGLILCRMGRVAEGLPHLELALEGLPSDPRLHDTLAAAYAERGDPELALRHAERALELTAESDPAYERRAARVEQYRRELPSR